MKMISALAAAAALFAAQAQAEDLVFTIVNDSSADLVEFNVSPASSSSWEENLLDGGYLAPGYEIDVVIADGESTCTYDIRGGFADDSEAEDFGLDLCELGEYTFTD
jgi:opacity protein-like surface antigen